MAVPMRTQYAEGRRPLDSTKRTVAVLGASGFLGQAIVAELRGRGAHVRAVTAPRLRVSPERLERGPSCVDERAVEELSGRLDVADVIVNAAGMADSGGADTDGLFGANALLPLMAARAGARASGRRLVHISSIAVQGDGDLDESPRAQPFSPYSRSRAAGEQLLLADAGIQTVIFRPTSVHGAGRAVTRTLVRLARSPLSCVAGTGNAPTPQVLVTDVAAAVAELALRPDPVPRIALQPANGMTTGLLLRLLGGCEPRRVPERFARTAMRGLRSFGSRSPMLTAHARRMEMMLFGRRQVPGWLAEQGCVPPLVPQAWQRLAADIAAGRHL